ncbi:neuron navigator 3 [Biomphalaria glabrata]|nr:neuron navigator 3 [Biomphalaria glabrata]
MECFDDSSSISSGEISDTIAEISTDENLTGSSQGHLSDNPYNSLKRAPKDILSGFNNGGGGPCGLPFSQSGLVGKRVPNLGTSAFMGTDYNGEPPGPWGRAYSLTQPGKYLSNDPNKLLSSDPSDYGYGYGWPSSRSDGGYSSLRKMSSGSNPDYAYHSEGDYESPHRPYSPGPGVKKDTETNTDQSHLMEASMRRLQAGRGGGSSNNVPSSNGAGTQFGYRRPLSNASNSSNGSSKGSATKGQGSTTVGCRLAKHGVDTGQLSIQDLMLPRPASASGKPMNPDVAMMEGFSSSTLDRKKKNGGISPSKSTGCTQTDRDFQSNSLGRRRLFGSKNSLSKSPNGDQSSPGQLMVGGTIISNPHATYGRELHTSHYVNLQELHSRIPGSNYVPLEFASSPRNSSLGSPSVGPASMWLKSTMSGVGLPPPLPPHVPHPFHSHAMSDSETFESLASPHVQAQIQQARALTNARMLAHHADTAGPPLSSSSSSSSHCLHRSNSIKSDSAYCSTKHSSFSEDLLPRTGSFTQLASPQCHTVPASPTLSQSYRFTYPMTYSPGSIGPVCGPNMVRSNTQSSMPFSQGGGLGKRASRDEGDSCVRRASASALGYSFFSDSSFLSSVHGSNLSLVSSSSSLYSSAEEKHAHEVRKLKRDLLIAQEKVQTLTNQLCTNVSTSGEPNTQTHNFLHVECTY